MPVRFYHTAAMVLAVTFTLSCAAQSPYNADYFVSPDGSDENPGTWEEPFQTLERARNAVRVEIEDGLTGDITVMLRGGLYLQHKTTWFGPEDSGNALYSITYRPVPGESAHLVGGVPVTGWQRVTDDLWAAPVPDGVLPLFTVTEADGETREGSALLGAGVRTILLMEDGEPLQLARHPNTGYLTAAKPDEPSNTTIAVTPGDLDPDADFTHASVSVRAGHDWFSQLLPVSSMDDDARRIGLGMETMYAMREDGGDRYYIRNVLHYLDTPGEYCIDPVQRLVYVRPRRGTTDEHQYLASSAGSLISIKGRAPEQIVRNLHFTDLDLSFAQSDAVRIEDADHCSVTGCLIQYSHECGVQVRGHADHIAIENNLIRHTGSHAVLFEGIPHTAPGSPDVNNHNRLVNNHIHHCGELYGHGYGVMLYQSGENEILHNDIHDMPRSGIMIKATRYQALREHFGGLEWGEQWQYQHSRNNLIAYNRIHHTMQDSEDAGAIDSRGAGKGNVFDHNLIYEIGTDESRLMGGICIDDGTDYYTVSNNIVWGINGSGGNQVLSAKGVGGVITNNIFICPPARTNAVRTFAMAGERNDSLTFTHNIIYFEGGEGVVHDFPNWSDDRFAASDNNVYYTPDGELVWSQGALDVTFDEWRELYDGKFDRHSVIADPLFTDPASGDFSLKPGSPAREIGFEPIDTANIGLTGAFPARFAGM